MNLKSLLSGVLVASCIASCKMPADVSESVLTLTPQPSQTATVPPIPSPTATQTPTPTPIPSARIDSGDQALFIGDWEIAIVQYQTAFDASSDPDEQTTALLGIGRGWLLARNYFEATNVLEDLIQKYPDSAHIAQANLTLGHAYQAQEHYSEAADAYLNYLVLRPGVIDGYVLNLRADALFAAGDYGGAALDYQAATQSPSLLDSTLLQMKTARALAISREYQNALALYDEIFLQTEDDDTRALIDLRKGQIYSSLGETELAWTAYLDAVVNYPKSYYSYSALIELVDAGAPVDELDRGIVDYYAGEHGVALASLDRYLQNDPADPATGLYFYGLTSRALGGYEEAIEKWDRVIKNYPESTYWDEAWEGKAYTQWFYLEQYQDAIQTLLDFADLVPTHPRAAEFIFDAAAVAERSGDLELAAELYERVINLYPADEQAQRALFMAGISRYRGEDYKGARENFKRLMDVGSSLEDRAAALLWIGKTQSAAGDQEAAKSTWEQAASVDPTGYYSERAYDLLHERDPFTPPEGFDFSFDLENERIRAEAWVRATFGLAEDTDMSGLGGLVEDPHFQRGTELWQLGMYNEARIEFEELRQSAASDAVQTYRLANYFAELGLYRSAILAARGLLELALMDDAETLGAPKYFNYLRFGTYYEDLIIPIAQEYGLHPLFLFSVVRQESLFESFIRSSAAASGLMQIMPATGADIAENMGWPDNYSAEDLYRPIVSVNFGADYLDTQRNNFDGDMYAVLAAYNGGPGNATEWRKLAPDDPDAFLEVIRYPETRNYIRVIYEVFNIYRWLYDRTS